MTPQEQDQLDGIVGRMQAAGRPRDEIKMAVAQYVEDHGGVGAPPPTAGTPPAPAEDPGVLSGFAEDFPSPIAAAKDLVEGARAFNPLTLPAEELLRYLANREGAHPLLKRLAAPSGPEYLGRTVRALQDTSTDQFSKAIQAGESQPRNPEEVGRAAMSGAVHTAAGLVPAPFLPQAADAVDRLAGTADQPRRGVGNLLSLAAQLAAMKYPGSEGTAANALTERAKYQLGQVVRAAGKPDQAMFSATAADAMDLMGRKLVSTSASSLNRKVNVLKEPLVARQEAVRAELANQPLPMADIEREMTERAGGRHFVSPQSGTVNHPAGHSAYLGKAGNVRRNLLDSGAKVEELAQLPTDPTLAPLDPRTLAQTEQELAAGTRRPVVVKIDLDGQAVISDGRHLLAAALKTGRPNLQLQVVRESINPDLFKAVSPQVAASLRQMTPQQLVAQFGQDVLVTTTVSGPQALAALKKATGIDATPTHLPMADIDAMRTAAREESYVGGGASPEQQVASKRAAKEYAGVLGEQLHEASPEWEQLDRQIHPLAALDTLTNKNAQAAYSVPPRETGKVLALSGMGGIVGGLLGNKSVGMAAGAAAGALVPLAAIRFMESPAYRTASAYLQNALGNAIRTGDYLTMQRILDSVSAMETANENATSNLRLSPDQSLRVHEELARLGLLQRK